MYTNRPFYLKRESKRVFCNVRVVIMEIFALQKNENDSQVFADVIRFPSQLIPFFPLTWIKNLIFYLHYKKRIDIADVTSPSQALAFDNLNQCPVCG